MLSSHLFSLDAKYILSEAGLEKMIMVLKPDEKNINNLPWADDTTGNLTAENTNHLQTLAMKI